MGGGCRWPHRKLLGAAKALALIDLALSLAEPALALSLAEPPALAAPAPAPAAPRRRQTSGRDGACGTAHTLHKELAFQFNMNIDLSKFVTCSTVTTF